MEPWRQVWREGIAPLLPIEGIKALHAALVADDAALIQGATTSPPPLACMSDWPVKAACLIGYCGWKNGEGLETVLDVEVFFANICYQAAIHFGETGCCRYVLDWFDNTPRDEMRREMIAETELLLKGEAT